MTAKSTKLYKKIFSFLRDGLLLNPALLMSDFEAAARKAALLVWPQLDLAGCYFHFAQALRRKARMFPLLAKQLRKGKTASTVLKVLIFNQESLVLEV